MCTFIVASKKYFSQTRLRSETWRDQYDIEGNETEIMFDRKRLVLCKYKLSMTDRHWSGWGPVQIQIQIQVQMQIQIKIQKQIQIQIQIRTQLKIHIQIQIQLKIHIQIQIQLKIQIQLLTCGKVRKRSRPVQES